MGEIGLCVGVVAVMVASASSMDGTKTVLLEAMQQAVSNKNTQDIRGRLEESITVRIITMICHHYVC